ncbi:isoprenoid synthase domain-containing protein [Gloeopeniophorella convolvens]|nr:isoprenoid synthase domain-containing protein [Gloeopeniophorella convolvens]
MASSSAAAPRVAPRPELGHARSTQSSHHHRTTPARNSLRSSDFEVIFQRDISPYLLSQFRDHNVPQDAIDYFSTCLAYNFYNHIGYGPGIRVVDTVADLKGHDKLEGPDFNKTAMLGWAVLFLQAYFLVSGNIIEGVEISGGKLAWHRRPQVGFIAINDTLLLEGAAYQLVREYFQDEPCYVDVLELLHEARHPAFFRNPVPKNYQLTVNQRKTADIYKSAIYSYYLPIALAMIYCGFPVEKAFPTAVDPYDLVLDVLLPIGEYAQVQDDYFQSLDGTLDKTKSWCYDTVLASGSPEQVTILEREFGKADEVSRNFVEQVFNEVGVGSRYDQYAKDAYERISNLIDAFPELKTPNGDAVLRADLFRRLLDEIHERSD